MGDPGGQVILYTTSWCGYCVRLKRGMDAEGISYREVDVDRDHRHDEEIRSAAGGNRTVPTVDVGGRLLVHPTIDEVKAALTAT